MIARIKGILESIREGSAYIQMDEQFGGYLAYEVLLPTFTAARLGGSIGQMVALSTYHFLESQGQGATMIPRLAGFLTDNDKHFFELFTTCRGIGNRKALRAMSLDIGQLAAAIADRDIGTLQSLPEIGRRTAETIVATLRGKVDRFLTSSQVATTGMIPDESSSKDANPEATLTRQALVVLMQLGENRAQAVSWVDQVMSADDNPPDNVQDLITKVYQIKEMS